MQTKYGSTSLCDQNCGVQSLDKKTHTWTDKSLKTEGPMILSNDIFFFKTVIIGGPTKRQKKLTRKLRGETEHASSRCKLYFMLVDFFIRYFIHFYRTRASNTKSSLTG